MRVRASLPVALRFALSRGLVHAVRQASDRRRANERRVAKMNGPARAPLAHRQL